MVIEYVTWNDWLSEASFINSHKKNTKNINNVSKLNDAIKNYNRQLKRFYFNEAAKVLYDFVWSDFCDWYIEIAKTRFYSEDIEKQAMTYDVCLRCIRTILPLMHPYTPFITEELWSHFKTKDSPDLIVTPWIKKGPLRDKAAENDMDILKELVTSIRSIRSRMNVAPSTFCDLVIRCNDDQISFIDKHTNLIISLARVENIFTGTDIEKPEQSATAVSAGMELYIPLKGLVDLEEEKWSLEEHLPIDIIESFSDETFLNFYISLKLKISSAPIFFAKFDAALSAFIGDAIK